MVIDLLNKKEQSNVFNLFETKILDLGAPGRVFYRLEADQY